MTQLGDELFLARSYGENLMKPLKYVQLVGATGIALILATPGFAQTVTNQVSSGDNAQTNTLTSTSTGTGITVIDVTSQNGSAAVNQIGGLLPSPGVASPSVSVTTVNDTVGGFQLQQALDAGATAMLGNTNNVAAIGTSSLASSVTAAGNQSASGNLNTAAFATANLGTAPAQGSLIQALGTGTGLAGVVGITSSNSISAQAANGAATVGIAGTTTLQSASANINSALASPGSAGAALGLDQKAQNGGGVTTTTTNVATANSANGGIPTIDPSVNSLTQAAQTNLNTFSSIGTNAISLANATSTGGVGSGGQNASFAAGTNAFEATQGNLATATTGSGQLGVGSTAVNNVSQLSTLNVNTVAGGGSVNFGNSSSPFQQTASLTGGSPGSASFSGATTLAPVTVALGVSAGSILANGQAALTSNGNATINASGASAQQVGLSVNSATSGGLVSGNLLQTNGADFGGPSTVNAAAANTTLGNAAVNNLAQQQVAMLNNVSAAGGASGLSLTQNSVGVATLGGANTQSASTTNGVAAISGATQSLSAGLNTASFGSLGGGANTIQQNAAGATLTNANTLTAHGAAAVISGASQSAVSSTNVIR